MTSVAIVIIPTRIGIGIVIGMIASIAGINYRWRPRGGFFLMKSSCRASSSAKGKKTTIEFHWEKNSKSYLTKSSGIFLSSSLVTISQRTFLVFLVLTHYLLVNFRCYKYVSCAVFIKKKKNWSKYLKTFCCKSS